MSDDTRSPLETQNQLTTDVPHIDGCPVDDKLKCHQAAQGQNVNLLFNMRNKLGGLLNLNAAATAGDVGHDPTALTAGYSVELRMQEAVCSTANSPIIAVAAEIVDEDSGWVKSEEIPQAFMSVPGIYLEEWGVYYDDGLGGEPKIIATDRSCLFVQKGMFAMAGISGAAFPGPPDLMDIKLSMRDFALENQLLDDIEFDGAEIAQACIRPVRYWNEMPPSLGINYSSSTFPYRELWMKGIQAYLLQTAEHHYRRDALQYSAGGLTVQDKDKHGTYGQAAATAQREFLEMVKWKKTAENMNQHYGSIDSEYGAPVYGGGSL